MQRRSQSTLRTACSTRPSDSPHRCRSTSRTTSRRCSPSHKWPGSNTDGTYTLHGERGCGRNETDSNASAGRTRCGASSNSRFACRVLVTMIYGIFEFSQLYGRMPECSMRSAKVRALATLCVPNDDGQQRLRQPERHADHRKRECKAVRAGRRHVHGSRYPATVAGPYKTLTITYQRADEFPVFRGTDDHADPQQAGVRADTTHRLRAHLSIAPTARPVPRFPLLEEGADRFLHFRLTAAARQTARLRASFAPESPRARRDAAAAGSGVALRRGLASSCATIRASCLVELTGGGAMADQADRHGLRRLRTARQAADSARRSRRPASRGKSSELAASGTSAEVDERQRKARAFLGDRPGRSGAASSCRCRRNCRAPRRRAEFRRSRARAASARRGSPRRRAGRRRGNRRGRCRRRNPGLRR